MSTSIKDKLKAARRAERVVPVCLRGDLAAEFTEARSQFDQLPEEDDSLAAGGKRRELRERMEQIRGEMAESTVDFRLRALPRTRWSELIAKYPPREGVAGDKRMGVNEDEFSAALIREGLVEPELDEDDWAALEESLSFAQWVDLGAAAWALNQSTVNVPFLPPASPSRRISESG
jgi:hypothetical protein